MKINLTCAALIVAASTFGAWPVAAATSGPAARTSRYHHHHHLRTVSDIARYRLEQKRVRASAAPVVAPGEYEAGSDAAKYGYVNNANCPAHLTNPHQATPDGFWYTPFGKRVNCF